MAAKAPYLTDAQAFQFESNEGLLLELFGRLIQWSDKVESGLVEKQVVKRAGALHQRVGTPPRRFKADCMTSGARCRAEYRRVCDIVEAQPEGRVTHPTWGSFPAVLRFVEGRETPGDERDTIYFTLDISETGLRAPPKPSPAAKAQAAATSGTQTKTLAASEGADIAQAGELVELRAAGFVIAMAGAAQGLDLLPDVDASLAVLLQAQQNLEALGASKDVRRAAAFAAAQALEARNRLIAGRPVLLERRVEGVQSLGAFCQALYGSRAAAAKAEILRLNRIARPFAMPSGTVLLCPDPSFVAVG